MHILLVGPGALGCMLAAVLSRGMEGTEARLSLLDHHQTRTELLNRQGILYDLGEHRRQIPLTVTANPSDIDPADILILCVKSYDIPPSLRSIHNLLQQGTLLLFLQNGISHLDYGGLCGRSTVAFGTTTEGANLVSAGHVRHAGHGETHLGFPVPADEHAVKLLNRTATILKNGGLTTFITADILERLWAKLFINVGINALTAINNCTNGDLLTLPGAIDQMRTAIGEAEKVACARDISIQDDPCTAAIRVCQKTALNVSSMLQDVRRQRRTEIDAINGAVVKEGAILGIETPENIRLVKQVREIEAGYLPFPHPKC